jgi:5'-3' exonuclease
MQVHLIDGTFELYRSFFGAPRAIYQGQEVGAVRGLLRSLLGLLRSPQCTHIAIAFDQVIESFRNDLYDGYKTGEGMEPELWSQFPLAEEIAHAAGIVVWPMVEFEADDALATAAARYAKEAEVERVLMCTPDKDLAQCVEGKRVVMWDRMRDRIFDEDGVREKWGVGPESIPDLLALMGDSADGIPGIPRWGLKSTSIVLAEYGNIESIPDDPELWTVKVRGAKSLAENLVEQRENAMLYKTLTILRRDVPITEDLDQLRWQGARRAELERVAAKIGDERVLDRISQWRDDTPF